MLFYWMFDRHQVFSRTLLSILANLNNAVFRMVSNGPLISKSSCHFTMSLKIVASAPITIGITVTFMFHSIFSSLTLLLLLLLLFSGVFSCGYCVSGLPNILSVSLLLLTLPLISMSRWYLYSARID